MHEIEKTNVEIEILYGDKVTEEYIEQALQIDYLVYPKEYHLDFETCKKYFEKNKYIYFMAFDKSSKKIVGYLNFSPIRYDTYEQIKSGQENDTIITDEDILEYKAGEQYYAYFSSIAVQPLYQKCGIGNMLINAWKTCMTELEQRNIRIKASVADVISEEGMHIAEKLGFSRVNQSERNTIIMEKLYEK